jgi:hypothetical protein
VKVDIMDVPAKSNWNKFPPQSTLDAVVVAMKNRGFKVIVVDTKMEALQTLKDIIPAGVDVMTGSSTSLNQVGFMDYYLKEKNPWNCLGPIVYNEKDPAKQQVLRRKSTTADYFVASVNAVSESGELVACDRSGSRVSAYPFAAGKLVLLVGIQKICKDLETAMKRVREYVFALGKRTALARRLASGSSSRQRAFQAG